MPSARSILRGCSDWDGFCRRADALSNKAKGDAFELLVKLYLQIDPQYRTKLRSVWLYDETPAKVRKHLRLPARDMGIDLVAETNDREYWAIQAKYRTAARRRLAFRELSTFAALTYTTCRNFDYALVCTTTDRISRQLEELPDRIGVRSSEVWLELPPDFFRQVRARLAEKTPKIQPLKPRPHQKRAIQNAV